jgi:antitoxin FitA
MPTSITLKGIPDAVYERLKVSASVHHRSLNSEVIACLEAQLMPRQISALEHLAAIRSTRERLPADAFDHDDVDRLKRQGRA